MKRTEKENNILFEKSVNILINAFVNDNLINGSCTSCAIGNLLQGYNQIDENKVEDNWFSIVHNLLINDIKRYSLAKRQLAKLPYNFDEIEKIEKAFESNKIKGDYSSIAYQGLLNVIGVLEEIHEIKVQNNLLKTLETHAKRNFQRT